MTHDEHEEVHRDLGVYVLGALEPAERERVERHLVGCEACRDEVASLAVLPALLRRLGDDVEATAPPPLEPVLQRVGAEARRQRWRDRALGAVAALALVAVAVVVAASLPAPRPGAGSDDRRLYAADDGSVTAAIQERPWGMAIRIEAVALADRRGYTAVAVSRDGHRAQLASWRRVDGAVALDGACYLSPDDVARVEITAGGQDEVVHVLRPV